MDIRNVQKTGNMHYIYLPTSWCKKLKLNSKSKVILNHNTDGTLLVSSESKKKDKKEIYLELKSTNMEILSKVIVACYISPAKSFKIKIDKPIDFEDMAIQKKLAAVEFVQFDGKDISCESFVSIDEPLLLLRTMIKKLKRLTYILLNKYNKELIERYEEEIDRSKLMIERSVVNIFTNHSESEVSTIYLYYISLISKHIERFVDHIRLLDKKEKVYLENIVYVIDILADIFLTDEIIKKKKISLDKSLEFAGKVHSLPEIENIDNINYHKKRVRNALSSLSETLMDWSISSKIE